jgi:hypothetical protein
MLNVNCNGRKGRGCVGKREPAWKPGGPARQEREKAGSWLQTVEEDRRSKMAKEAGDRLATSSRDVHAQSECCCALHSSYTV